MVDVIVGTSKPNVRIIWNLNRGQIDSSRESVNLVRLPNGVRLTPFEGYRLDAAVVSKYACWHTFG